MEFYYHTAIHKAAQFIIVVILKVFLLPWIRRSGHNAVFDKGPALLISNHRTGLDPFLICAAVPWSTLLKILPIRFMTHNVFYDSPLQPILWLMGCFPAKNPKENHDIYGVEGSIKILRHGASIFIFPEGTRIKTADQRGVAKTGVTRIHHASPSVPFVLAHITYNSGIKSWVRRERYVIKYKFIKKPNFDNPESIMDEVFALN